MPGLRGIKARNRLKSDSNSSNRGTRKLLLPALFLFALLRVVFISFFAGSARITISTDLLIFSFFSLNSSLKILLKRLRKTALPHLRDITSPSRDRSRSFARKINSSRPLLNRLPRLKTTEKSAPVNNLSDRLNSLSFFISGSFSAPSEQPVPAEILMLSTLKPTHHNRHDYQTESRFRPLARLLLMTSRPFFVRLRTRNPCVLFLLTL